MDDGASLDELKRRAYSSDGADAVEARERLAVLVRERDDAASAPPELTLARFRVAPAVALITLALAAVASVALATVSVVTPRSSLDVFSRPQTSQDLQMPGLDADAVDGSARWIGSFGGFEMFAYLRGSEDVCVIAVEHSGAHMDCTTRSEFAVDGVEIKAGRFTSTGTEYYTLEWGPFGPPRYEGHSVDL